MSHVVCGVGDGCTGNKVSVNAFVRSQITRAHADHGEAFDCKAASLVRQGYKRLGPREFQKDDGPILILTKRTRFGVRLRGGKSSDKSGARFNVPKRRGNRSGLIA